MYQVILIEKDYGINSKDVFSHTKGTLNLFSTIIEAIIWIQIKGTGLGLILNSNIIII